MTIYLWSLLGMLLIGLGIYWYARAGNALAADTVAHDSHEADPSPGDQRGRSC